MRLIIFLALLLPLAAQTPHQVNINYDFTGFSICPPGTQQIMGVACYDHFEVQNVTPTATQPGGIASIPIPVSSGAGAVNAIPLNFTSGFTTVYVVMVARAADGTRVTSNPKQCAVTIPPNPPTGAVLIQ